MDCVSKSIQLQKSEQSINMICKILAFFILPYLAISFKMDKKPAFKGNLSFLNTLSNKIPEETEEKAANFLILPKNYDLFSLEMDEYGMIELEESIWSGLIESTPNEPNLGYL